MENQLTQIGIIGAGELGHALGAALTRTHMQVLYYDTDPTRSTTGSIEDLVSTCQVLLVCVPSWAVKDVLKQLNQAANPQQPRVVVSFAKGVEPGFVTMDKVLRQRLPEYYDTGVLFGPMIANEIDRGRPAHGVLALSDNRWFAVLRDRFAGARMYLEGSGDAHGVAVCAVLKNVYAIGFGIADGLNLGLNTKGKLAVMVLAEMKRLVGDLGGDPRTAEGIAGLGDLLATGFGEESFNYRVGKSLAERIAHERIKSEGLVSLHELGKHIGPKRLSHYPVAHAIDQIVFRYGEPHAFSVLLSE